MKRASILIGVIFLCFSFIYFVLPRKSNLFFSEKIPTINSDGGPTCYSVESLPQTQHVSPKEEKVVRLSNGTEMVKDEILITFKENTSSKDISKIISSVNGCIIGGDKRINFFQVQIKGADIHLIENIIKDLESNPQVDLVSGHILIGIPIPLGK